MHMGVRRVTGASTRNRTLATCVQVKILNESANACYLNVIFFGN